MRAPKGYDEAIAKMSPELEAMKKSAQSALFDKKVSGGNADALVDAYNIAVEKAGLSVDLVGLVHAKDIGFGVR
jgi:hypothetical protein